MGARDPLLHRRRRRDAALRARLVHARLPWLYALLPGVKPVPPTGRRRVPDRRARRHSRRLCRASLAHRCPRRTRWPRPRSLWRRRARRCAFLLRDRPRRFDGSAARRDSLPLAAALASSPAQPRCVWARPRLAITRCWPVAACSLVAFTTVDLAYNNGPDGATALPPATYDVLQPDTRNATIAILKSQGRRRRTTRRDRIELAGLGFHWPNASLTHSLENTLGYNPLRLALYSEATGAEDHVGLPDQRKFSPLFPSYRSHARRPARPALHRHRRADRDMIDSPEARRPAAAWPAPATATSTRTPTPSPACCLPPRRIRRLRRACWPTARWPDVDLRSHSAARDAPPEPRHAAPRPASARIVSYRNTEVSLEADSPDGGWVVLNDVWHPWWFAEVDGRPAADPARQRALPRCRRAARAGIRCGSRSARWPAPWPSSGAPFGTHAALGHSRSSRARPFMPPFRPAMSMPAVIGMLRSARRHRANTSRTGVTSP